MIRETLLISSGTFLLDRGGTSRRLRSFKRAKPPAGAGPIRRETIASRSGFVFSHRTRVRRLKVNPQRTRSGQSWLAPRRDGTRWRALPKTPQILVSGQIPKNDEPAKSRYIASEVSERVHAREGYQCAYSAPDGTRCIARTGLQIEHVRPFGIFRSHDERFLKLLCPAHNGLAAERVYGAAFIQRKIDERRRRREAPRNI